MAEKSHRLNARITPEEWAMFRDLAEYKGITVSDLLRIWIREEHAAVFGEPTPKPKYTKPKK